LEVLGVRDFLAGVAIQPFKDTNMKTLMRSFVVCLITLIAISVEGQSTFNLLPPAIESNVKFACAEVADGKVTIIQTQTRIESRPLKADEREKEDADVQFVEVDQTEVEVKKNGRGQFSQTYQVQVPYTETVTANGKQITRTKIRVETRTRLVPVPNMKDMKVVEYESRIPYSENVWNGKDSRVVQRWRTSTMSKAIPKDHELVKVTRPIKNAIDPANASPTLTGQDGATA